MIHRVAEYTKIGGAEKRHFYVISAYGVWLPGVYDTERAARYAFRFGDGQLRRLQDSIRPGNITFELLKNLREHEKHPLRSAPLN